MIHPVGQFWVLQHSSEGGGALKGATPEIFSLVHIEPSKAAALSLSWLSDKNKELFTR